MSKNYDKKYYLGLDIGTESIGWALTDENYKLLRANNKNLWGVRLFDPAETAANRRLFRESRRRLQRRKWRIGLLQEIFAPLINSIDSNFFVRLADSNLYGGDKREKTIFSLFNDVGFTDREFYNRYKTIYHLRLAMMSEVDPDPRLAYLALHHIVKYRGHFLIDGDLSAVENIRQPLIAINAYLEDRGIDTLDIGKENEIKNVLKQKCSKTVRAQNLTHCFDTKLSVQLSAVLELIAGKTVKAAKLPVNSADDKLSICFDGDWDSAESAVRDALSDDYILIENAKLLYDYSKMKSVCGDYEYLSQGMVEKYEKHKSNLAKLKQVMKKYFTVQEYDKMFRDALDKTDTNYTAYSGKDIFGAKNRDGTSARLTIKSQSRSYEDFVKYVKKVLNSNEKALQDADVVYILQSIEEGTFMPKQVSKNNATLPYQLNLAELNAILNNLSKYSRYAFLKETDNGVSVADKIRSLLTFRMPYYVGPVNNHSGKYWIVRKEDGKILPWNYQQKIDLSQSQENFVKRMTGKCPYFPEESVLPKCSLLYEEFAFLNTINCIKINGEPLPAELKRKLSCYYATNGESKISSKVLKQWLLSENAIGIDEDVRLEGFDENAKVNRRTYYNFQKIFGNAEEVERHNKDIERMILLCTVIGSEKSNLRKVLQREFAYLTEEQVRSIVALTCKGWGRYSSHFLNCRVGTNPFTGEINAFSIIDALRAFSENFMQVYNNPQYGFRNAFEKMQLQVSGEITYEDVDELYCSPAVKKQIWQTLEVVKELKKIQGHVPTKIFVEVARGVDKQQQRRDERNRSVTRYKQLYDAFEKLRKQNEEFANSDVNIIFQQIKPQQLNSQKLFLYFMQNGKDIYTGEPIDYNHLELYDKDHIYPRSKVKDDSLLNNLVLTEHRKNVVKADKYPLDMSVQQANRAYWLSLKKCGLITEEKYKRLTRNMELTPDEMADFINRQIVETQQTTKEVIGLLRRIFPESEIVWSKASNVTDFRKGENGTNGNIKFVKSREINDLHHAKDAYLNIVVGNTYNTRYGHDAAVYFRSPLAKVSSPAKLFESDVGVKNCTAWQAGERGTICQVVKTMQSNAVLFTRESKVAKGQLFNATIYKKNSSDTLVPLKGATNSNERLARMSDPVKYGGYNSETRPYFMLVKYTERKGKDKVTGKTKYRILDVAAKDAPRLDNAETRRQYCVDRGLTDPVVLIDKIKIHTMFDFCGTLITISGLTGAQIVWRLAQQYNADEAIVNYVKKVSNVADKYKKAKTEQRSYQATEVRDEVSQEQNKILFDKFIETLKSSRYQGVKSLLSIAAKLDSEEKRKIFDKLSLEEQCVVLCEILKLLQCNATTADLTLLQDGANCGKICTSSTLDSLQGISIVHRSVTGVFEQKIPLTAFDKE